MSKTPLKFLLTLFLICLVFGTGLQGYQYYLTEQRSVAAFNQGLSLRENLTFVKSVIEPISKGKVINSEANIMINVEKIKSTINSMSESHQIQSVNLEQLKEQTFQLSEKAKVAALFNSSEKEMKESSKHFEEAHKALTLAVTGLSKSIATNEGNSSLYIHNLFVVMGTLLGQMSPLQKTIHSPQDLKNFQVQLTKHLEISREYFSKVVSAIAQKQLAKASSTIDSLKALEIAIGDFEDAASTRLSTLERRQSMIQSFPKLLTEIDVMLTASRSLLVFDSNTEQLNLLMILGIATIILSLIIANNASGSGTSEALAAKHTAKIATQSARDKQETFRGVLEQLASINEGDLTVEVKGGNTGTQTLIAAINTSIGSIREVVSEAKTMVINIASASEHTALTAQEAETSKNEQLNTVESSTGLAEEVFASVERINNQMSATTTLANKAQGEVINGSDAVENSHEAVLQVGNEILEIMNNVKTMIDGVQNLHAVSELISEISAKIKMLSFNVQIQASNLTGHEGSIMGNTASEMAVCSDEANRALSDIVGTINGVTTHATETQLLLEKGNEQIKVIRGRSEQTKQALSKIQISSQKVITGSKEVKFETENLSALVNNMVRALHSIRSSAEQNSVISTNTAQAIASVNEQSEELSSLLSKYRTDAVTA